MVKKPSLFFCSVKANSLLRVSIHSQKTRLTVLWTLLYLLWFIILFCNKGLCKGIGIIKLTSLWLEQIRQEHQNTDNTDGCLFNPPNQNQKLSKPFPLWVTHTGCHKGVLFHPLHFQDDLSSYLSVFSLLLR